LVYQKAGQPCPASAYLLEELSNTAIALLLFPPLLKKPELTLVGGGLLLQECSRRSGAVSHELVDVSDEFLGLRPVPVTKVEEVELRNLNRVDGGNDCYWRRKPGARTIAEQLGRRQL
jgi:hypothetical protein